MPSPGLNPAQKSKYFRYLWPDACAAQGWDPRDDARRRAVTLYATGDATTRLLDQHQITALFVFLAHLADPRSGEKMRQWECCRADRVKYNHARQAEHWRRRAGYAPVGKLNMGRFGILFEGEISPEHMDAEQVEIYLMTHRERVQDRELRERLTPAEYKAHLRARRLRREGKKTKPVPPPAPAPVAAGAAACPF
jgi:hypothetical protein